MKMLRWPNPLIAEPLYLTKNIERMGTGIRDMIQRCRDAGLPEPEIRLDSGVWVTTLRRKTPQVTDQDTPQVTPQVTAQVTAQVAACCKEQPQSAKAIMSALGMKHWKTFQTNYLLPLIDAGVIERTIPDKPTSRLQKYRITEKGRALLQ